MQTGQDQWEQAGWKMVDGTDRTNGSCMGADPEQEHSTVEEKVKRLMSNLGFELLNTLGKERHKAKCFPEESFSTVGRPEGCRSGGGGGMAESGLCHWEAWDIEGHCQDLVADSVGCVKVGP